MRPKPGSAPAPHRMTEATEKAMDPRRRASAQVLVGGVALGGTAPIRVQSMTNTDTADADATARQCAELWKAGSELVRITVNTRKAAQAVPRIREMLDAQGCAAPLVGDFHYNGHKLLAQEPACAQALAKYRINPGNVGRGGDRGRHFASIVEIARDLGKPVRIGVNWGSLDQELLTDMMDRNAKLRRPQTAHEVTCAALVESTLQSAESAMALGLPKEKVVLSCKVSEVPTLIRVYREIAARCDHPLHVGLTEAGMGIKGIVSSATAIGMLLGEGIGDTIRVSLTPQAGGDRCDEVRVAAGILQSLGLRSFAPSVAACPGCGRTDSTFYQRLAQDVQERIDRNIAGWKERYPGVEDLKVAVMGCVVNGPGESRHADIGISLPGSGEDPVAPVFVDGEKVASLKGPDIAEDFNAMLDDYIRSRFG